MTCLELVIIITLLCKRLVGDYIFSATTNHYFIPDYEEVNKNWRSDFRISFIVGLIFFFLGLIISIIGITYKIHFPLDFNNALETDLQNIAFWILLGVLLILLGLATIRYSYFYKDKITRFFGKRLMGKHANQEVGLNYVVNILCQTLERNMIQYYKTTAIVFLRKTATELRIVGKNISVFIEPEYSHSKYHIGKFLGARISIGPEVSKDNPEVIKIINLIESTLNPRYTQPNLYGF